MKVLQKEQMENTKGGDCSAVEWAGVIYANILFSGLPWALGYGRCPID